MIASEPLRLRHALVWLALATWLLYAATATGSLSIDPNTRFLVAENLVRYGDVALQSASKLTVEHEGRHYAVFFPGQSIVFLPVAAAGVACEAWLGVGPGTAAAGSRFVACVFLLPAFCALAVIGHVRVLRLLGVAPRTALLSGAMLAFGTTLWVWGTNGSEESILGALGIWIVWLLLDAGRLAGESAAAALIARRVGLAGVLIACGLVHRSTFVTGAAGAMVMGVILAVRHRSLLGPTIVRLVPWFVAAVGIVSIVPAYNWLRFGDPLETGYGTFYAGSGGVFDTPLLVGLAGHLVSPGEGIFLYVPWLILLPFVLPVAAVRRRLGMLFPALLVIVGLHLLVYSLHTSWNGAFGWSVRFHVSLMPLVLVPITVWLDGARLRRPTRAALAALAALSIANEVAGKTLNAGLEHMQPESQLTAYGDLGDREGFLPGDAAWTWRLSQLRLRYVNIAEKLLGRPLLALDEEDPVRIRTVWNVFPARAAVALEGGRMVTALWILWASLVAAGAVAASAVFYYLPRTSAREGK